MKKEEIQALFEEFEQAACEVNGIECWSARGLCSLFGYTQWRNFVNVIDKAKEACNNAGQALIDHFADVCLMDKLSPQQRHANMAAIRSKDTKSERILCKQSGKAERCGVGCGKEI